MFQSFNVVLDVVVPADVVYQISGCVGYGGYCAGCVGYCGWFSIITGIVSCCINIIASSTLMC
jgi:hypothetical protein